MVERRYSSVFGSPFPYDRRARSRSRLCPLDHEGPTRTDHAASSRRSIAGLDSYADSIE